MNSVGGATEFLSIKSPNQFVTNSHKSVKFDLTRGHVVIPTQVNNQSIKSMLDTGSYYSLLHSSMMSHVRDLEQGPITLTSVNKHRLSTRGVGTLSIQIAGYDYDISVVVVDDMDQTLILGLSFMDKYVGSI